jgi:hypothetical protein
MEAFQNNSLSFPYLTTYSRGKYFIQVSFFKKSRNPVVRFKKWFIVHLLNDLLWCYWLFVENPLSAGDWCIGKVVKVINLDRLSSIYMPLLLLSARQTPSTLIFNYPFDSKSLKHHGKSNTIFEKDFSLVIRRIWNSTN